LPVGFAEPGRSPALLVSFYLAVSPLPWPPNGPGGLFSVALSLPGCPGGGCYPPPRPVESGLSSGPRPRHIQNVTPRGPATIQPAITQPSVSTPIEHAKSSRLPIFSDLLPHRS